MSSLKDSSKATRPLTRHNTLRLDNTFTVGGHGGTDSFAAFVFPKKENRVVATKAKKHEKHDAEKLEELRMSNEALKAHLMAVVDRAQQLERENDRLRNQHGLHPSAEEDDEDVETEIEATL